MLLVSLPANKPASHTMRRLCILFLLFVLGAFLIDIFRPRIDQRPLANKFKERLNRTYMLTYTDTTFGFCCQYPAFFTVHPPELIDYIGCAQFSYRNEEANIVLEYHVANPIKGVGIKTYATYVCKHKQADMLVMRRQGFILSGSLYGSYRFHEKHLLHGGLWHVYSLCYPETYQKAVARLIHMIDHWQVEQPDNYPLRTLCPHTATGNKQR